jgi:hypothetical protein
MLKDLKSIVDVAQSIAPVAATSTKTGSGIDLSGYHAATAEVSFGVATDGTHTPKLQESDDNSTFADVVAADLLGSFSAVTSGAGGSAVQRVGYIGAKRYVRVVVTVAGATTGALVGANVMRGFAQQNALA